MHINPPNPSAASAEDIDLMLAPSETTKTKKTDSVNSSGSMDDHGIIHQKANQAPLHPSMPFSSQDSTKLEKLSSISFPSLQEKILQQVADQYRRSGILPFEDNDTVMLYHIRLAAAKHLDSVDARIALLKEKSPMQTDLITFLESYHKNFKAAFEEEGILSILKNFKTAVPSEEQKQLQTKLTLLQEQGDREKIGTALTEIAHELDQVFEANQKTLNHLLEEPPDLKNSTLFNLVSTMTSDSIMEKLQKISLLHEARPEKDKLSRILM